MVLFEYGVWRPLERTSTHISKIFSFEKYPALSSDRDGIDEENVAPSPRSTESIFEYI